MSIKYSKSKRKKCNCPKIKCASQFKAVECILPPRHKFMSFAASLLMNNLIFSKYIKHTGKTVDINPVIYRCSFAIYKISNFRNI